MNTDPQKVKQIFMEAVAKDSPEDRANYLDRACGQNTGLRTVVEDFLKSHGELGEFLDLPAVETMFSPDLSAEDRREAESIGVLVGPYKLLELIGEGGFGNVYMAEQQAPIRRKVALKIIKLGMDTCQVIARFEAERQALALMDHANIAKVFDAGATESGRPYFVMELVRGIPVTEYCDGHNLTTQQRLRLFIDVCRAVQHAHQKGIIHRDIKPTNVLVTRQDGKPVPKVIDFGVAKATTQRLTEKTLFTKHRQLVGTPEYMSPEQATFGEEDVDTRSDIYSLGVLLYELLVGTTPFDVESLRTRGYDEVCRVIRESDPPTPSQRLSTLGDGVSEISKRRHVEPDVLRKLLRRDLDWITMRALEKDRTRRYETAHDLAQDVERHLNDEPVRARPPNTGYRLKKLVRKHRVAVVATVAVLSALVVGLAATAVGFARAEHERRIATAERDQAKENLYLARQLASEVIRPATERMFDFPFARAYQYEVLEKARVFYEQAVQQAEGDPEPRREMARIHELLGKIAWETGRDAETSFQRSLSIREDLTQEFPSHTDYRFDLSSSHAWLSNWYSADLRLEEAAEQRRISLGIARDLAAKFPSNDAYRKALVDGNSELGRRLTGVGKLDDAQKYSRAAFASGGRLTARVRVLSAERYAYLLIRLARYDEAEQVLALALETAERELPPIASPPSAGWGYNLARLASCHRMVGLQRLYTARYEAAEKHLRKAIDLIETWSDDFPVAVWLADQLGSCHHDLAEVQTAMGRLEETEESRRKSLATWESVGTPAPAALPLGKGLAHYRMGEFLHRTGRTAEAGRQFAQAQAIMEDLSRRRPDESICHWQLICLLANCPDPALRDSPRAVALAKHVLPARAGHYWRYLALAQYRSGDWQEAADSIRQAMDLRQGGDAFDWLLLAMAHWQLDRKEEALARYSQAQEAIKANKPIFYEYIGVMAVDRLRKEAELLLGKQTGETEEE